VEGAHKTEEAAERGVKYGARKLKQGYRSHKLKPYREAAKAEKAAFKANVDFQYHKTLHDNPQLTSNPLSRFWQKQQIKKQYAKAAKQGSAKGIKAAAENTRKAAKKAAEKTKQTAAFVARHPAGVAIAVGALLLFILIMSGLSSCGAMFSGTLNGVLGTSYTSEDSDLVEVENAYAGLESELQREIDNIESTHSGYDEYRYDLANIGHNPHELASYLTAKYQSYTRADVQTELQRIFEQQYKLTLTEEVEMRYREEERTDTWTDEDGNEHTDTYTVQVPYSCTGKEAAPEEPTEQAQPQNGMGGLLIFLVVGLLGGGAALYYFKVMKSKQNVKGGTDLDEFDFDEYDEDEPEEADSADTEQEDEDE